MIHIIQASRRPFHFQIFDQMFRLRCHVFRDTLKWHVHTDSGLEFDRFDLLDPIYLISVSDKGRVNGTFRLLPTMGPHMLIDVFPQLLQGRTPTRDPFVWEATRFAICPDPLAVAEHQREREVHAVSIDLFCALGEIIEHMGISHIISVHDCAIDRLIRRIVGYAPTWKSRPIDIGATTTVATEYAVKDGILLEVMKKFNVKGQVVSKIELTDQELKIVA